MGGLWLLQRLSGAKCPLKIFLENKKSVFQSVDERGTSVDRIVPTAALQKLKRAKVLGPAIDAEMKQDAAIRRETLINCAGVRHVGAFPSPAHHPLIGRQRRGKVRTRRCART